MTSDPAMSFWDHVSELRRRLLRTVLVLFVGFFAGWTLREPLFVLATRPVREGLARHGIFRLTAIETVEAISVYLKLSVACALLATVPFALWELWRFVRPGLKPGEVRPLRRVLALAMFMFAIGVLFCYRLVLPLVMDFLAGFTMGSPGVDFQVTMQSAYTTALFFLVAFGLAFELPLVMVLLAATPLLSWRRYLRWVRHFIVLAFVLGAIFTPPDVLSQLLLAVPLCVLYGVGILFAYLMERRGEEAPEESGPDWALGVMVAGLAGLVVLLAVPPRVAPTRYLPAGARWYAAVPAESTEHLPCPLPDGTFSAFQAATRVSCAGLEEGPVTMVEALDLGEHPCGHVAAAACTELDRAIAVGPRLTVARVEEDYRTGNAGATPVSGLPADSWAVALAVPGEARAAAAYLVVSVGPQAESGATVSVSIPFSDPAQAERFAAAVLAEKKPLAADESVRPAAEMAALRRAVSSLADAVEAAAAHSPEQAESLRPALAQVRAALKLDAAAPLLSCTTSWCLFARLSPRLPDRPVEAAAEGRVVTVKYVLEPGKEQRAALLESLRRELAR